MMLERMMLEPFHLLKAYISWVPIPRNIVVEDKTTLTHIPYMENDDPTFLNELYKRYVKILV